jgi:predicted acetyltransferase
MGFVPVEIVHPVAAEEVRGWHRALARTFLSDPDSARTRRWAEILERDWEPRRNWGARDRGQWVATLGSEPLTITVPGRDGHAQTLMADGITHVTVAATHRRRGLLGTMIEDALREARERGDAISMLIAAEYPIYGRYGYAPATETCDYSLFPRRPGGRLAGEAGRVRQVERDEYVALAPAVFERFRRRRAGQVQRHADWWPQHFGGPGFEEPPEPELHNWLVHEGDDGPDGLLAWLTTRRPQDVHPLALVDTLGPYAATDAAERDLWAHASGLDLVEEIIFDGRPVDEPVRWLLPDQRTLVLRQRSDYTWVKLLDVPAALSARAYSAPGELVLELTDDAVVSVAGRYHLIVESEGTATCQATRQAPDLTLPQTVLASVYLGGNSIVQQQIASPITEHTPGAARRADAMFTTALAPWNTTNF